MQTTFTADQETQIQEYAAELKKREKRLGFYGYETLEDRGRREHKSDARTIESWEALGMSGQGPVICADIRLRMAARKRAFKLAKLRAL
jgi:hypothetical protein